MAKNQNLISGTIMELKESAESTFAAKNKKRALKEFKAMPMPNKKDSGWRCSEIEKLDLCKFDFSNPKAGISAAISNEMLEKGVILCDINSALDRYPAARKYFLRAFKIRDRLDALNLAYFSSGIFLYVPKNVEADEPIKAEFNFESQTGVLRNMVIAEPNSRFSFAEEHSGKAKKEQLNSSATAIFANENSKIDFCHLSNLANADNFANVTGTAEKNSEINYEFACFGSRLNRLEIGTILKGEGSRCINAGIFLGKGNENIDVTTNAYHLARNTSNRILVDGILKDNATCVYRGLIKIEKGAQKTSSHLANHILKLSDKTLANSIPSLKIDANDVKASHAATVGQIDEEQLFYLMSRGLQRSEAEKLVVEGFFEPIIQKMPLEELKEKVRKIVKD